MTTTALRAQFDGIFRLRPLLALLLCTAALMVSMVSWAPAALAVPPTVEIADEAGVLDDEALSASLASVDFRRPVQLKVLTFDAAPYGSDLRSEDGLCWAVGHYVEEDHPEWPPGGEDIDGLIIITIDPSASRRNLGPNGRAYDACAAGDAAFDRNDRRILVTGPMFPYILQGEWEQAVLTGAEGYAEKLD